MPWRLSTVHRGVPSGKEIMDLFGGSGGTKKRVFLYRRRGAPSSSPGTNPPSSSASGITTSAASSIASSAASSSAPSLTPFASPLAASAPDSSSVSSVTSSTSFVSSSTAPPSPNPPPSFVGLSASTGAVTSVLNVVNTPISAPAVQDSVPASGRATRRYLTTLAEGRSSHEAEIALNIYDVDDSTDLLQSPFDDDIIVVNNPQAVPARPSRPARTRRPARTSTNTRPQTSVAYSTGFRSTPFHGEGIRAGIVSQDLSTYGLGGINEVSRSDEVATCLQLLQDACTESNISVPPFLSHAFEELCWQARESGRGIVVVLLNERTTTNDQKRKDILRVLDRVNQLTREDFWFFWTADISSCEGQKVIDMYGGDNYTERIIFLCPTTTRDPTFIGQFIDTDMDELVTERIMERARNLISALVDQRAEHSSWRDERARQDRDLHEAMQKEAAEKQQLLHAQEENQDGRAEEQQEMLHVDAEKKKMDERAEKIRQARKRRLPSEPGGGTKIFIRTLSGEKLQRAFAKTALFQEVYDWAGSLPGMPLYFTLQRGATTVRHTDPLGSDEVLNICERDETEMAELNMSEVTFRGNVGEAEEDFSQTLEDARLSNDASEAQEVDGTNKSEKNAADHQNMTDVNENSQTSQPGLLVKQKATQSAADKSTTSDHAQRDTSQENIRQTESLVKDTSQSNDTSNQQKADGTDNSGKKAKYDESRPDGNKENQAGQPGLVDKQKEKENTCDKSTATDAKRDTSRANKQKTESPDKDARQSNDARKRQKVDDANIPGKNARDDEGRPDKDNENQAGQTGPVDKQKEKENACDKSTATDTQKDTTMATKQQTESPDKDARKFNDTSKGQKVDGANNPGKNAADDESRPDRNDKNPTRQPGPVETQKETQSASDKSTASEDTTKRKRKRKEQRSRKDRREKKKREQELE